MSRHAPIERILDEFTPLVDGEISALTYARQPLRHLYKLVADYPERGGRHLRSSLCLAACAAFGGSTNRAMPAAVAIELLHNAFLVHDDIEDESELRRGRPTLHVSHGTPLAVNTGDALCVLAMSAISNAQGLDGATQLTMQQELQRTALESVEGQAIELGWRADNTQHVTPADYLKMVQKKTCWYTMVFPLRAGALAAGRTVASEDFVRLGYLLGSAFQIHDDVLNLMGDEASYGKEINGDILEGKRTLMLVHALEHASPAERTDVLEFLNKPRSERSEGEVLHVRSLMDRFDSIGYARQAANELAGAAESECERLFADPSANPYSAFLFSLPRWVVTRS